ncbi:LysR family transcriptional regulator [Streptomyces sp. PRKS01-65]|nr:LysR substrate-binding domain-containing protein [Streptomyces harenosi]NEY35255.1 LysR family transcriptional regulator [Streptomyces harenosi]
MAYQYLDPRHLRTLITIVDTGGFRRAAESLNLSQPAVSQHVRRLESLTGAPIFLSTKQPLRLSLVGEELLSYARRIIEVNDEAVTRLGRGGPAEVFRLGMSEQLAPGMPKTLARLQKTFPTRRIDVRLGVTEDLVSKVRSGDLDVVYGPRTPRNANDRYLGHIRLSWYGSVRLAPGEPLPLVVFTEPCNLRRHILSTLRRYGIPWRIAFECPDLAGIRAVVGSGTGVTCLIADPGAVGGLPVWQHRDVPVLPSYPLAVTLSPALPASAIERIVAAVREGVAGFPLESPARTPAPPMEVARAS